MARYQPSGKCSRKGILFPDQALSFALGSRARDYRNAMVGSVVLRPQAIPRGTRQWSTLSREHDAAQFTPAKAQRRALNRTSTRCTRSARRARRSSRARRARAGDPSRRPMMMVAYKVDRLTRSLADFAKMVEVFDAHGVSFVAVTQQFNTTTSMGRLTLNVLLSFAQFEREVTGERIRDKIAASKKKGMWMGGC